MHPKLEPKTFSTASSKLIDLALLFLKLGTIGFGGPAAHIALMRREVVERRRWVTNEQFLDLLGAANMIPGPSSTEIAIFLGYLRAGWSGLIVAGVCFILPATLIVLGLAWAYSSYGSNPEAAWLLKGVRPVIIAVILQVLWELGRAGVKSVVLGALGFAVLVLYLSGFSGIALLFGGGFVGMVANGASRARARLRESAALAPLSSLVASALTPGAVGAAAFGLGALFLTFLKIGAIVYGSGYLLLAFLRADFVERLGWLSQKELIDAVAIGQFTPGPVFTTATFIGYLLGGIPGALVSTLAIFLPGFLFAAMIFPMVSRLRRSQWTSGFLDGVNVSALGLIGGVVWQLGRAAITDPFTAFLALLSAFVLIRFRINSAWLVLGGGLLGLAYHLYA